MDNNKDLVFHSWKIGENIGSGTDGRVSYITRINSDGVQEKSVLKTMFFHENRNEPNDFNKLGKIERKLDSQIRDIVESVTGNIQLIMEMDNGKRFVKYEEIEVKQVNDGYVLHIRMEQMRSLEKLLTQFSMTREEALKIAVSICRGLIRCRKFEYVYPNLKPENILFDAKGRCKLGDFGSFSCLEPAKASIAFRKSEYYMAPEYIKTGKINTTCDTYSLGLILYMLTNRGRLPFADPYPQVETINGLDNSKQKRLQEVPLPKPVLADDKLFSIIKKACAYEPSQRYLTPSQMLADLKNVIEGKPLNIPVYEEVYSNSPEPEEVKPETNTVHNDYADFLNEVGSEAPPSMSGKSPLGPLSIDDILAGIGKPKQPAAEPPKPQQTRQVHREQPPVNQRPEQPVRNKEKQAPKKQPEVSLKDIIKIPNVRPRDYNGGKKQEGNNDLKTKFRFFIGDLPQSKEQRQGTADIKKLAAIIAAIVVMIILIITSFSIRASRKNDENPSIPDASQSLSQQNSDTTESLPQQVIDAAQSQADLANTSEPDSQQGDSAQSLVDDNGVPINM